MQFKCCKHARVNPYLTLLLIVQPQILINMGDKRAFTGNGMLERFLYVIPKSNLGYRKHDTGSISESLKQSYSNIITRLLELNAATDNANKPIILTISAEALKEWRAFQKTIEFELRPGGKFEPCIGWGGKISGYALRLAGLIHVCETLGNNHTIGIATMEKALELAALLIEHSLAAFGIMGADAATADAKELLKWIDSLNQKSFTKSELTYAMRNRKFNKSERIDKALLVLIERHYISIAKSKVTANATKPTTYYDINPKIRRA